MTHLFVAVHVGAGFHSDANSKELKSLCKKACKEAMAALRGGVASHEATALAISILENSSRTNAGLGSNLSLRGTVECDASVMDTQGNFGAVGAVEGVVNPIHVAHSLMQESSQGCLPLGRVPPLVLVGQGAQEWAKQRHLATCCPDDLITDRARAVYLDHMSRLEEVSHDVVVNGNVPERAGDGLVSHDVVANGDGLKREGNELTSEQHTRGTGSCPAPLRAESHVRKAPPDKGCIPCPKKPRLSDITRPPLGAVPYRAPLDTVGAICLDSKGEAAAGVSSGGISLKCPGRVGQAAMFGCGCWAEDEVGENSRAVACSTSGTGEYIIKTSLARECAMAMVHSSLQTALDEQFLNSKRLRHVEQKLAGAIALHLTTDNVLHFSWGHTTESMCLGFMADTHKEPMSIISKMEPSSKSGLVSHVQAISFQ